jgi:hypothetical protein
MQFNQTNNNARDVNNAISKTGDVVQTVGNHNAVKVEQPKPGFWSLLWKKMTSAWAWIRACFTGGA